MAVTGIIYNVALANLTEALQTNLQWANVVVHIVMPIVVVVDFFVDRTVAPLGLRDALWWLIFPPCVGRLHPYPGVRGGMVSLPVFRSRSDGLGNGGGQLCGDAVGFLVLAVGLAYSTRVFNRSGLTDGVPDGVAAA